MTTTTATLFISGTCPHCPAVMQSLTLLVKAGKLARLDIYNIELNADAAATRGVRSVPWVQPGPFELTGLRSQNELLQWIEHIDDPAMMAAYFAEQITSGDMDKVQTTIEKNPHLFGLLLQLMSADDTSLSVRIGIGTLMEDFTNGKLLNNNIDTPGVDTMHTQARVRTDACHYLGLSRNPAVEKYIRPLLNDIDTEVREVAAEALQKIGAA
ncbi:MAG: HEAT repeat domain-containing protein [Gammaproteobacteria bacterium]|nr:HEAT repeat domain-containing protein [Gammaproteobacteria bacterium]